jgi:hypothetical protein
MPGENAMRAAVSKCEVMVAAALVKGVPPIVPPRCSRREALTRRPPPPRYLPVLPAFFAFQPGIDEVPAVQGVHGPGALRKVRTSPLPFGFSLLMLPAPVENPWMIEIEALAAARKWQPAESSLVPISAKSPAARPL